MEMEGGSLFAKKKKKRKTAKPGKDPRTFEENSQFGDLSTPGTNSQGKDPRTFLEPVERWRVQKKSERKRSGRKRRKRRR